MTGSLLIQSQLLHVGHSLWWGLMQHRESLQSVDNLLCSIIDDDGVFPRYSELHNYSLPDDIRASKYTPPTNLRLTIEGAEIREERPVIKCAIWCTGNYYETKLSLDTISKTDIFVDEGEVIRINFPSLQGTLELLKECNVTNLDNVTLRQYVDIVRNDSMGIVDYSTLQNISLNHLKDIMGPVNSSLFEGTPYDFQMDGIRWMWLLCKEELGLILGDEMGLGKTFQIIFLFCLFKERLDKPSLVVCPATLVKNWSAEIKKFAPSLKIYEHKGPHRTGSTDYLMSHDVVITSYDTLIANLGELQFVIGPIEWSLVVLDEAQAIKNPEARRSMVVKELNSLSRISVTGTPLENRVTDVWSLFDFSLPGFLGNLEGFEQRFPNSVDSATKLERVITPFILRRLICDVKDDLPERIDMIHGIDLSETESTQYLQYIDEITDGGGPDSIKIAHMQKLRVYCTHPNIYQSDFEMEDFSKFIRLIELLGEVRERRQKAVIFTSFRGMIDRLCEFIPSNFHHSDTTLTPLVEYIDGRNSSDALDIIERFGEKEGFAVLALNPRAAGTGLTITSANHVFHYNPEYNPALMAQATARVHRIGQEHEVIAHWMYCRDTIEERIMHTLDFKRELFDEAIHGIHGDADDEEALIRAALGLGEE